MHSSRILALLALTGCLNDGFVDYYDGDGEAPSISAISPNVSAGTVGGETVVIQGAGFGTETAGITVMFGDQNAEIVSVEDGTVVVVAPRGPLQGGAVRVAVGTEAGQVVEDGAFGYDYIGPRGGYLDAYAQIGEAAVVEEAAYLHISNDYFSCLGGVGATGILFDENGPIDQDGDGEPDTLGCENFAYTGLTGVSGRSEFMEVPFARVHSPFIGDKAGFAGAGDQSLGDWTILSPALDFNEFDIQGLYDDRRIEVGEFTVRNPALTGDSFCVDETSFASYTYSGGDAVPGAGEGDEAYYRRRTLLGDGALDVDSDTCEEDYEMEVPSDVLRFCKTPDYDDAYNFQYDASWLAGSYLFADRSDWQSVEPTELGAPTVVVDIPGKDTGFALSEMPITLPEYAFFEVISGGSTVADFEGSSGLSGRDGRCRDTDGDGAFGPGDAAYVIAWRPATPYVTLPGEDTRGEGVVDERLKYVSYYVQVTVSVLTQGWLGGEGISLRAVHTVPDTHNYDPETGLSTVEIPNKVWYSLPTVEQGGGGLGAVSDPYRGDYGQYFLTIDRVAEYEIRDDENPGALVLSYSTGNMGLQPIFTTDSSTNPLDRGECGDCEDNDGDGWFDTEDVDCSLGEGDDERGFISSLECNDGIDNDGDGLRDANDPDCESPRDRESGLGPDCGDGRDNDSDGWVDLADPDCFGDDGTLFEEGFGTAGCNNGRDDDGDGWEDADDPDCTEATVVEVDVGTAGCNDGIDNDGDGDIDADDADCTDALAEEVPFESSGCYDGVDNDADGWTDGEDPECYLDITADELGGAGDGGPYSCNDGADDDGDGWQDAEDPDCVTADAAEAGLGATACNNGLDDDGHGDIDAEDPYCLERGATHDAEAPSSPGGDCTDGFDNDSDGYVDANDPDCEADPFVSEFATSDAAGPACYNGVDDDTDGDVDAADSDCVNALTGEPDGFVRSEGEVP